MTRRHPHRLHYVPEYPGSFTIHHPHDPRRVHGWTAAGTDTGIRRAALATARACEYVGGVIVYRDTTGRPQTIKTAGFSQERS
jgi:hypothetical protein